MTKELSIENIKKELINKISNNSEILEYFENHLCDDHKKMTRYLREYGTKYIKDNCIVPYDMSMSGYCNFITVEVTEDEMVIYEKTEKHYTITIMVNLEDKNAMGVISVILGNIATELYPDRSNYRNIVSSIEDRQLVRVVQFTIK